VLGLDLRGGTEVILRAVPERNQSINSTQMQTARNIIEQRVNSIGVASPNVAVQGSDEIVVQLAGINDPTKAAAVVGQTGKLQFFDFETDLASPTVSGTGQPAPLPSLYGLLSAVKADAKKGKPEALYLFKVKTIKKKVTTKVNGKKVTKQKTTTIHKLLQGRTMTCTSSCCRTTGSSRPIRRSWRFRRIASRSRARRRTAASARGRTASRRPARTGTSSSTSRTATAGRPS
jgi:Preprotein translocase subunit SecD